MNDLKSRRLTNEYKSFYLPLLWKQQNPTMDSVFVIFIWYHWFGLKNHNETLHQMTNSIINKPLPHCCLFSAIRLLLVFFSLLVFSETGFASKAFWKSVDHKLTLVGNSQLPLPVI
jgi:hypothetical protein